MNENLQEKFFLWNLFQQLRRRGFSLGISDYFALRQALRAGFGLPERHALRDLCCAVWAKSLREQEVVEALFEQLAPQWEIILPDKEAQEEPVEVSSTSLAEAAPMLTEVTAHAEVEPVTQRAGRLPKISLAGMQLPKRPFVFVPQFPLTYREVAQAWRRLRRPVRQGPRTELDIDATIEERSRKGIISPVVLVPPRRNAARVLLLVDRQGSMAPFHHYVEEVCAAMRQAGRLETVALYYFHDVPAEGADRQVLASLGSELFPALDAVLPSIEPVYEGSVYKDEELLFSVPLKEVLRKYATAAYVVIISDGGAARRRYDVNRLLNTVSFLKALRRYTSHVVWLNPLPRSYWSNCTAMQIARHIPMFPLERTGLYYAVNVLRGHPHRVERPV